MNDLQQLKAVEKLSKLKVGALFMEMGTGKTKVALDLISAKRSKVKWALWVCPFSTKHDVREELEKWHPELKGFVEIIGAETLSMSDREYLRLDRMAELGRCFMVVDESLKIKNVLAKRTSRILALGKKAYYRLILNGTPVSKNVIDLWSQMEFLSHKILNMGYREFKDTFAEYYIRGRLKGLVRRQVNVPALIAMIEPYVFDSRLSLGLGKRYLSYKYSLEDIEEYQDIKNNFFESGSSNFYALATSLQECYCKSNDRKNVLCQLLDGNEQTIVYVRFLDSIPDDAYCISGDMPEKARSEMLDLFRQGKVKTLWITYGCGTFGLNLQCCHRMIFLEHSFDYSQRIQSEARIYRLGQESPVTYISVECNTGLESMILRSLEKKTRLLDEIKKEIQERGEEAWLRSI